MTLPLWISQDQAARLKAALEGEGFEDVTFSKGSRGGELIVAVKDNGAENSVSVMDPMGLEIVVPRFLKWRDQRNG